MPTHGRSERRRQFPFFIWEGLHHGDFGNGGFRYRRLGLGLAYLQQLAVMEALKGEKPPVKEAQRVFRGWFGVIESIFRWIEGFLEALAAILETKRRRRVKRKRGCFEYPNWYCSAGAAPDWTA
jgi:hypothetical protein